MSNMYLVNNKLVTISDYANFFGVTRKTAGKMFHNDVNEFGFKRFSYADFYGLYQCFPSRHFKPVWVTMGINA